MYKKLRIETRNGVGYILLGSGSRFNKLTSNTLRELNLALVELQLNHHCSCIVVTGYPGESFAVGADIDQMVNFEPADAIRFAELGQALFVAMEECPKPIIGALNGITMGGGCDLALACDIRLACDSAVIAHPGARLGIITGFCGTQKLPRLVGKNCAREIFMTSAPYSAPEALRTRLVDHVYPESEFWPATVAFAERIAANNPASLAFAKKALNAADDIDLKNGCVLETAGFAVLCATNLHRYSPEAEGISDGVS